MKTFKATIVGVSPLMQHNERLADPTNPLTRNLKKLTAKRAKTDDDLAAIKRAEWEAGLVCNVKGKPSVPVDWLLAALRDGAKKSKLGQQAKAGIFDPGIAHFELEYTGPKAVEKMYDDGRYVDYRGVGVNGKRVMRARPIFPEWRLAFELNYDPETIEGSQIEEALRKAGQLLGIGDYRPRFGRFMVEGCDHG